MEVPYSAGAATPKPAIYSPRAVLGFSAAFSTLAGGILTFQSLRAVGRPAAAWQALGVSVAYVVLTYFIVSTVHIRGSALAVGLGFGGGTLLNELFLKKQLPDEANYPRKSIVVPLIICLVLVGALLYFVFTSVQ